MENGFYSVISPEGCASILLRDASQARHSASLLKLTSEHLLAFKVVDRIVPEPPGGAHTDPPAAAAALKAAILSSLGDLDKKSVEILRAERHARVPQPREPSRSPSRRRRASARS